MWDKSPVHIYSIFTLQNRAGWVGFQLGNQKYFCKCFLGETSRNGSTDPGRSPVCCNPCHHLRFRRFPGLSHATSRCAGHTCRCSVPCAVCMSSGASSLQSDAGATELCLGLEAETTVASLLQRSHLGPSSPQSPEAQTPRVPAEELAAQYRKARGIPGFFQTSRMADLIRRVLNL